MTLITGSNPRHESQLTTRAALARLDEPTVLGRLHKPVPHARLVDAIGQEVERRGYAIAREQLALSKTGAALFGILDLKPTEALARQQLQHLADATQAGRTVALGFRNATDQQFGIRAAAGAHVMVCDNMVLSGDLIAISRKNTTRLDLGDAIALGFDKFLAHSAALEVQLLRLEQTTIEDGEAKRIVYDLFAARVLPARLFDDVHDFYFTASDARPDCAPRSLWGLHNACTRAAKDLSPIRQHGAIAALGSAFQLRTAGDAEAVIDAVAVSIE